MTRAPLTVLAAAAALLAAAAAVPRLPDGLPDAASGPFVQRKTLKDVDVTLASRGDYAFEKGRFFTLHTRAPVESVFTATPTNYTFQSGGKTTVRAISVDVSSLESVFRIREVKEYVKDVQVKGTNFPYTVTVAYRNGDLLEIELQK